MQVKEGKATITWQTADLSPETMKKLYGGHVVDGVYFAPVGAVKGGNPSFTFFHRKKNVCYFRNDDRTLILDLPAEAADMLEKGKKYTIKRSISYDEDLSMIVVKPLVLDA